MAKPKVLKKNQAHAPPNESPSDLENNFKQKLLSMEISLKKYIDNRLELYYDALTKQVNESVDSKYRKLHSQKNGTPSDSIEGIEKEEVIKIVELVISEEAIEQKLDICLNLKS